MRLWRKRTRVVIQRAKDGGWYFVAKSRNGKVIADSEVYTRRWAAERGARRAFPDATIIVEP